MFFKNFYKYFEYLGHFCWWRRKMKNTCPTSSSNSSSLFHPSSSFSSSLSESENWTFLFLEVLLDDGFFFDGCLELPDDVWFSVGSWFSISSTLTLFPGITAILLDFYVCFGPSPSNSVNILIDDWSAATASSCFVEFSGPWILANSGVTSIGTIPHFLNPLIELVLPFPSNALTSWLNNWGKISFGIADSFWPTLVFWKPFKMLHQEVFNGLK